MLMYMIQSGRILHSTRNEGEWGSYFYPDFTSYYTKNIRESHPALSRSSSRSSIHRPSTRRSVDRDLRRSKVKFRRPLHKPDSLCEEYVTSPPWFGNPPIIPARTVEVNYMMIRLGTSSPARIASGAIQKIQLSNGRTVEKFRSSWLSRWTIFPETPLPQIGHSSPSLSRKFWSITQNWIRFRISSLGEYLAQ